MESLHRGILISGAVSALLAVALGAFAAHGLKNSLDAYSLAVFKTGVDYQMYHGLALLLVGILAGFKQFPTFWLKVSAVAFLLGIIIFSGSLYVLATSGIKWLGAITPIGGIAFLAGWSFLIVACLKAPTKS